MPKQHRERWRQRRYQQKKEQKLAQQAKAPIVNVTPENAEELMANYIKFYKTNKLVPEEEWDAFFSCMLTYLPLTFRFGESNRRFNNILDVRPRCTGQEEIRRDFFKEFILPTTEGAVVRNVPVKIEPVSMFAKELVWKCNVDHRGSLGHPKMKKFRTFLFHEERGNNLFKQDLSAMVGVWLVDILPHHKILELCSSPGYQSSQIAEKMHSDPSSPAVGFIMCNNIETPSSNRLNYRWTLGPNTIFIHEKVETFPDLYTTHEHLPDSKVDYDLVFLDAPSTKDGHFRKFTDARGSWDVQAAYDTHKTLKKMMRRAAELVAVDGKLVYKTISHNPVENEAVVADILRQAEGSLELVDISKRLDGFKTRPGMDTWKLSNPGMVFYQDYATCPTWFKKDHERSLFSPTSEEMEKFQLKKCMRILPHDNNTSGAFYAVLKKTSPLPDPPEEETETEPKETVMVTVTVKMDTDGQNKDGGSEEDKLAEEKKKKEEQIKEEQRKEELRKEAQRKEEQRKEEQRKQKQKKKPLEYETFMIVTEIDWETEVIDTDLTSYKETETIKYMPPGLKLAKSSSKSWYGDKSDFLFSRYEDIDMESPAWNFLSNNLGLKVDDPEGCLIAWTHYLKGTQYFYTIPLVKKIVLCNQSHFQKTGGFAAGLFLIQATEVEGTDRAVQPQLPLAFNVKKRVVPATKSDLIALLSKDTVHMSALSETAQQELKSLDDKGPIYFIYEPSGQNPDPKCPMVLMRNKLRIYIKDNGYNMIENTNYLRLCGVDTIPVDEGQADNESDEHESKPKNQESQDNESNNHEHMDDDLSDLEDMEGEVVDADEMEEEET